MAQTVFNPEYYSLLIRKEDLDGETLCVGRVAEMPNVSAFENTYAEAHAILLGAIRTLKRMANEQGVAFPLPHPTL